MEKQTRRNNELTLIPKSERYIQYMVETIIKIPRTEKFSMGTEYKRSMYQMLEQIMYLNKIELSERFVVINKIDADLNVQRILLRIMYKNAWIDKKKFDTAMELIYELGKIIGGLIKYYGKNNKA